MAQMEILYSSQD